MPLLGPAAARVGPGGMVWFALLVPVQRDGASVREGLRFPEHHRKVVQKMEVAQRGGETPRG